MHFWSANINGFICRSYLDKIAYEVTLTSGLSSISLRCSRLAFTPFYLVEVVQSYSGTDMAKEMKLRNELNSTIAAFLQWWPWH